MSDDVIFSYSAEDAMRDGQLIEVEREFTQEAGFIWPVRITRGVYNLVMPSKKAIQYGQSFEGRMWDVLNLAKIAIAKTPDAESLAVFLVLFQNGPNKQVEKTLWAALDMTSGPAIHILLPKEY